MTTTYRPLIDRIAKQHEIEADLIEAMVMTESSGRFYAYRFEPAFWARYLANHPRYKERRPEEVSASYGLMQIMYPTAVDEGYGGEPWGLFSPAESLEFGCRHLARHMAWADNYGVAPDLELRAALAAYNGGRRGNEPDSLPDRNGAYADKVLAMREKVIQARKG